MAIEKAKFEGTVFEAAEVLYAVARKVPLDGENSDRLGDAYRIVTEGLTCDAVEASQEPSEPKEK